MRWHQILFYFFFQVISSECDGWPRRAAAGELRETETYSVLKIKMKIGTNRQKRAAVGLDMVVIEFHWATF